MQPKNDLLCLTCQVLRYLDVALSKRLIIFICSSYLQVGGGGCSSLRAKGKKVAKEATVTLHKPLVCVCCTHTLAKQVPRAPAVPSLPVTWDHSLCLCFLAGGVSFFSPHTQPRCFSAELVWGREGCGAWGAMGCSASAQGDTVAATCVERSPDWSGYGEDGPPLQGASAAESEYFLDYLRHEEANVGAVLGPAEVRTVYRLEKELRAEHTREQVCGFVFLFVRSLYTSPHACSPKSVGGARSATPCGPTSRTAKCLLQTQRCLRLRQTGLRRLVLHPSGVRDTPALPLVPPPLHACGGLQGDTCRDWRVSACCFCRCHPSPPFVLSFCPA